jgi:hypothetical protein
LADRIQAAQAEDWRAALSSPQQTHPLLTLKIFENQETSHVDTRARLHKVNIPIHKQIPKSLTHDGSTLFSVARVDLYNALYVGIAHQSTKGLSFTIVYQQQGTQLYCYLFSFIIFTHNILIGRIIARS